MFKICNIFVFSITNLMKILNLLLCYTFITFIVKSSCHLDVLKSILSKGNLVKIILIYGIIVMVLLIICSQLEAVVRIAESLAKMQLQAFATETHVDEALRLFQVSTLDAAMSGSLAGNFQINYLSFDSRDET